MQASPDEKRTQWTSKGAIHKSFNQEDRRSARRSSLRKYNSEPVPETEEFQYSREQSIAGTPAGTPSPACHSASDIGEHRGT